MRTFISILKLIHVVIITLAIYRGLQGDTYFLIPIAVINVIALYNLHKKYR